MSEEQAPQAGNPVVNDEDKTEVIWLPSKEITCPGWMLTFGDAMSLLLCFFVLLLTFSTKEEAQLMDVLGIIKGALSPVQSISQVKSGQIASQFSVGNVSESGEHLQRRVTPEGISPINLRNYEFTEKRLKLERSLKAIGFSKFVTLDLLNEGISLGINADKVFKPGTAELQDSAMKLLQGFAILCSGVTNEVRFSALIPSSALYDRASLLKHWRLALARLQKLRAIFSRSFNIKQKRISFGIYMRANVDESAIQFLLVERPGPKEVTQEELTNELLRLQEE
ncbi:MAG: hypothetical protein D6820_10345 [Lentisphaerae bacterium]|nr:MAG: hypothetical protein D6820_10345 [Lentisphaerota bacterium]